MSRRLLLEKEVGSTSSGCSDKLMAESNEAKNTSSALGQHINPAKVRHHEQCEPNKTCGPAKWCKLMRLLGHAMDTVCWTLAREIVHGAFPCSA